jgi:L-ascorbate metabolism protein UlaG (beta-lactamase superfamily)
VGAPAPSRPRAREDELSATWIGHSTVLLQLGGVNLITDPVFSERAFPVQWMGPRRLMDPALAVEALPPLDLILISHSHYDHLDRPAVRRLAQAHPDASWVVPLGLSRYIRGWGARAIETGPSGAASHSRLPADGSGSRATPRTTRNSAPSGRGSGRSTWS